eukprot:7696169-Karenia_brevis.AAC.2
MHAFQCPQGARLAPISACAAEFACCQVRPCWGSRRGVALRSAASTWSGVRSVASTWGGVRSLTSTWCSPPQRRVDVALRRPPTSTWGGPPQRHVDVVMRPHHHVDVRGVTPLTSTW